jgi:hypothetical protein
MVVDLGLYRHLDRRGDRLRNLRRHAAIDDRHPRLVGSLLCALRRDLNCAWKNVSLSAKVMLIVEGVSVALISLLCLIAPAKQGFSIDPTQVDTKHLPFSSLGLRVVVARFSLVGFESATAFGDGA